MANRKLMLISPELSLLLIKQLAHELKNYNLYLSFANFFGNEGITDLESYYRKRASEELLHHQWIMDYLTDADVQFVYPSIDKNTEVISDYITPFKQTVDREIQTTEMIYKIHEAAMAEKDFMTVSWLSEKLIREQIEEENTSRAALDIMEQDSDLYLRAERVHDLLEY